MFNPLPFAQDTQSLNPTQLTHHESRFIEPVSDNHDHIHEHQVHTMKYSISYHEEVTME